MRIRLDDNVAIVTGAGSGLGRSHALALARRGARVIVNDIGIHRDDSGLNQSSATAVVDEIIASGGEAVVSTDSVLEGERIVQCALDNFGRIDIIINNAGILRDKSFAKMSHEDWDLVYKTHVEGAFQVTHAAWAYLQNQEYGRIVFTTSAAGLYGNFGQANYAMAKMGLVGLMQTLALEGKKRNVLVNAIAPVAASRMTEGIFPADLLKNLKPELVTPLVVYLCSNTCQETGAVFEVGAGWFSKLRWERSKGLALPPMSDISPEDIAEHWESLVDFSQSSHPATAEESFAALFSNLNR